LAVPDLRGNDSPVDRPDNLKNSHRPHSAAAGRVSVLVDATRHARAIGTLATALVVLAIALATFAPAARAASGERGGASVPTTKAAGDSLTYDTFTNSSCSQAGFLTSAIVHLNISGPVQVDGQTLLNGVPYDTYAYPDIGPDSYPADFVRPRTTPVADPPFGATSNTYTFAFHSRVLQDGELIGTSITTITCTGGVFAAVNLWVKDAEPVPAGGPAGWTALVLLLAIAAARRLRPRRA